MACMLAGALTGSSQGFFVGAGFQQHYIPEYDKAIRSYNSGRPYLEEDHALIGAATYLEASFWGRVKQWNSGIQLSHSYSRSRSESCNFNTKLRFHQVQLSYVLRWLPKPDTPGPWYYFDLHVGATGTELSRMINGGSVSVDDEPLRAWGGGGQLGLTFSFPIEINKNRSGELFAGATFLPYFYSPNAEPVIHQTKGLTSEESGHMITWKIGIRACYSEKRKQRTE